MPKLFDERLSGLLSGEMGLGAIGAIIAVVYLIAAMAQLLVGSLMLIGHIAQQALTRAVGAKKPPIR
jgi:hypothetical protein